MEKSWNPRFLYGFLYVTSHREVVERKSIGKQDISTDNRREIVRQYVCLNGRKTSDSNRYA